MSTDYAYLAWEASDHLIDPEAWDTCGAPAEALRVATEGATKNVPNAIAKHPTHGWFVLESNGSGPYVVWWEKDRHQDA